MGNAAVGDLLGGRTVRSAGFAMLGRSGANPGLVHLQRDEEDGMGGGAQPLDTAAAGGGATETIGPPTSSTYAVGASNLADVVAVIGGRDEAGHVGWVESMSSSANTGPTVDTANVNVDITLEMPSWTPPSAMLPKARAEWTRWYAALMAHEQGHIKLVHDIHDGMANRLLGKTPTQATTTFNAAKTSLTTKSDAYDVRTGHGLKTGTVLDVGIETLELDEEQKKKDAAAAAKAKPRDSAVPDAPEDE